MSNIVITICLEEIERGSGSGSGSGSGNGRCGRMEMRIDVFVVGEGYCFGEGMGCGLVVGHVINCYRFCINLINRFINSIKY